MSPKHRQAVTLRADGNVAEIVILCSLAYDTLMGVSAHNYNDSSRPKLFRYKVYSGYVSRGRVCCTLPHDATVTKLTAVAEYTMCGT